MTSWPCSPSWTALQSQIQQLKGQLSLLTSETTYSTLTVAVTSAGPGPPPRRRTTSGLDRAWHDSVHGFIDGVDGLVGIAGPLLSCPAPSPV